MKLHPSLKANYRHKFAQDVSLNRGREKGKPQYKLFYLLLKEEYGYDPLLEIYTYPTLIQLKYFPCIIHHCVTVFGKSV